MLTNSGSVRCKASAPPATVAESKASIGFDKTVDTSGWPIDKNHPVYTGVVVE
jgi:hypothetical protein